MRSPLTVAAAQPRCVARDVFANARAHAEAVRTAGARVVVFPELSLTGYELDADAVDPAGGALAPLVDACAAAGSVAFVGAPVRENGVEHIATLRLEAGGAGVAYRKTWLGDEEARRFRPGPGPVVVEVDGWRLGLGICKDTGVAAHVDATSALGVDLYVAGLVHRPEELEEQEARGLRIARATGAPVAFAGFAGPTGGGYERTAGGSTIWSAHGGVLARAGSAAGELARATLRDDAAPSGAR